MRRGMGTFAFLLVVLAVRPIFADFPDEASTPKKEPSGVLRAAKLYDEALCLRETEDFEGCKSKLTEILALKNVDPYLLAETWALLADTHIQTDQFMQAAQCYEQAVDTAGSLSGQINEDAVLRWQLLAELIHKYPTGKYKTKPLSDKKVMQEALKQLAPARLKELEELLKSAREADRYDEALKTVDKSERIVREMEILDMGAAEQAREKVSKARAELLAGEIQRLMDEAEQVRNEILANKPRDKPKNWKADGIYQNPTEFHEAEAYWRLFIEYNRAVPELDRLADVIKDHIDELASFQDSHSKIKFKTNPKTLAERLEKLITDDGRQISRLDVPPTPKLLWKGRTITAKVPVGRKGYKPKESK